MSALPKAVQKQVNEANAIIEQMKKGDTPPAATPESPPAAAPPAAPPASPPAASAKPTPPVETPPPDKGWEHKYNVLQGKYNAEVPRLQKQLTEQSDLNRELRQRVNNMETTIASLQATRAPASEPPATGKPLVTPEEIDTFGPDLHDFIQRTARQIAEEMVAKGTRPLANKVENVERSTSQVSQTVAHSKQQETLRQLAAEVPNWQQLDTDQGFLDWLDQTDQFAGMKRGDLLQRAFRANDAPRVIAFFRGYLKENVAVTPEPTSSTPPPATPPPKEPQAKLEDLVAPGAPKAPTAGAPNDAGKRVWTQKEIHSFTAKKNEFVRRFPGKALPDEIAKLERDLFKAQHENRIQG